MFLDALKLQNTSRPPVWLMRQAGRYLPSYRALRAKHPLRDLFFTPDLAAEITLMPVDQLGVDAAILFSDITVVALPLGFSLDFSEGPRITGSLNPTDLSSLQPIIDAIHLIKPQLKIPLIGFCGGPYTVASYIHNDLSLLEPITQVTIEYLKMQERAGVDAIQIFDSWADQLTPPQFAQYCLPYLRRLIASVNIPVILFMRNAASRLAELVSLQPAAISFDHHQPLSTIRPQVPMAIQGNLDPDLLYQPLSTIRRTTQELLASLPNDPGFIVNLGHGVKPDIPVAAVQCLIDTVKESQK